MWGVVTSLRAVIPMISNGLCGDIVAIWKGISIEQELKKYLVREIWSHFRVEDALDDVYDPRVMCV